MFIPSKNTAMIGIDILVAKMKRERRMGRDPYNWLRCEIENYYKGDSELYLFVAGVFKDSK